MANFINELKVISYEDSSKQPTFEEMEKYYSSFDKMKELFSKEVLEKALSVLQFNEIATLYNVKEENMNYYLKKNFAIKSSSPTKLRFEEWKGDWHRNCYKIGYQFWIPSSYTLNYGKYIRKCLELTIPWFNKFEWNIYCIDNQNDWIYLRCQNNPEKTSNNFVYVPVSALLKNDLNKIIETHTNYFKSYYGNSEKWSEKLKEALDLLNTKEFKWFCKFFE